LQKVILQWANLGEHEGMFPLGYGFSGNAF